MNFCYIAGNLCSFCTLDNKDYIEISTKDILIDVRVSKEVSTALETKFDISTDVICGIKGHIENDNGNLVLVADRITTMFGGTTNILEEEEG